MRQLTMKEVRDEFGGKLPPDATLRADDGPERGPPPPPPGRGGHRPPSAGRGPREQRRRAGRFATLNAFVDFGIAEAGLTPAEAAVWFVLFRDTKAATGTARTAQDDIARRANLDPRTVRRAVAALETKGMLTIVRRGRLNCGPSVYCVRPTTRP